MGKYIIDNNNYNDFRDKPYSKLKPGQTALERDYYSKANMEEPDGRVTLKNFHRFDTNYNRNIATTTGVSDYKVPEKNANTMSNISTANIFSTL